MAEFLRCAGCFGEQRVACDVAFDKAKQSLGELAVQDLPQQRPNVMSPTGYSSYEEHEARIGVFADIPSGCSNSLAKIRERI